MIKQAARDERIQQLIFHGVTTTGLSKQSDWTLGPTSKKRVGGVQLYSLYHAARRRKFFGEPGWYAMLERVIGISNAIPETAKIRGDKSGKELKKEEIHALLRKGALKHRLKRPVDVVKSKHVVDGYRLATLFVEAHRRKVEGRPYFGQGSGQAFLNWVIKNRPNSQNGEKQ